MKFKTYLENVTPMQLKFEIYKIERSHAVMLAFQSEQMYGIPASE